MRSLRAEGRGSGPREGDAPSDIMRMGDVCMSPDTPNRPTRPLHACPTPQGPVTLEPGMGIVCNNVLHRRDGFVDDPSRSRLLYRARYLDRVGG